MTSEEKVLTELADSIGNFIQYWGFRKIHGKVWTLIYLSENPMATNDLLDLTGVSKGLMSTTISTLVDYGLIQVVDSENKKEKSYRAHINIGPVISYVLQNRERNMLDSIKENFSLVEKMPPEWVDRKKLGRMRKYIKFAGTLLNSVIKFGAFNFSEWKALEKIK